MTGRTEAEVFGCLKEGRRFRGARMVEWPALEKGKEAYIVNGVNDLGNVLQS